MALKLTLSSYWNITLCFVHYASLISDALTLGEFWVEDFRVYFWILLSFAILGWLSNVVTIGYLPHSGKKQLLLWITNLDYAAWVFADSVDSPVDNNNNNKYARPERRHRLRKMLHLIFHSLPSVFITTYAIFVGNFTHFIPQISLFFSLIDLSLSNVWLGKKPYKLRKPKPEINARFIKYIIKKTILLGAANISFFLLWGTLAAITQPWGAWIALLTFIFFPAIFFIFGCWGGFLIFALLSLSGIAYAIDVSSSIMYKFVFSISMGIVFIIYRENLDVFLAIDPLWHGYFYAAIGLMVADVFIVCILGCMKDDVLLKYDPREKQEQQEQQEKQEKQAPKARLKATLYFFWNLTLCGIHYASLISDALTLKEFWTEDFRTYFWILVAFAIITWLSNLATVFHLEGIQYGVHFLLWITNLDYAAWVFVGEDPINPPTERKHPLRKMLHIIIQSIPSIFITTHSIFVGNITHFIPQVSLLFSILDLSFSNAWLGPEPYKADQYQPKITWAFIKYVIKRTILYGLASISFFVLWGIMAAITRPWGAWISFPAFIIIPILLCGWCWGFKYALIDILFGIAYAQHPTLNTVFKCFFILLMGIVFIIFRKDLDIFLNADVLWALYFYGAIGLMVVDVLLICCLFYIEDNSVYGDYEEPAEVQEQKEKTAPINTESSHSGVSAEV